jgi:hypothetical protein
VRIRWLTLGAALVALCLAAGLAECGARVAGREPMRHVGLKAERPYMRPHPALGWVHETGTFEIAGGRATFWSDTSRATSSERPDEIRRPIILVGDSFTEGYGVHDDETFGWLLDARMPDRGVLNLGTAGYSTLQSLIMMEMLFDREEFLHGVAEPDIVFYGFVDHHLARNVALPSWIRGLETHATGFGGPIQVPYALLEGAGGLQRFPPEAWPLVRWTKRSAFAALAVDAWMERRTRERTPQMDAVAFALMEEMEDLAQESGVAFGVAFLFGSRALARHLDTSLRERGIAFLDCAPRNPTDPRFLDPETRHPTSLQHRLYAECLFRELTHLDG